MRHDFITGRDPIIETGFFSIKANDLIFIDIKSEYRSVRSELLKIKLKVIEEMSTSSMTDELKTRNIKLDDKVEKLIDSNFFNEDTRRFKLEIFDEVVIIKGKAAKSRSPEVLIRNGVPDGFYLIPPKITFYLAYLLTFVFSKDFLNLHNIDRIFIMSEPLEKFNEGDDNLILEWDPTYHNCIGTALYENPYSGDKNVGYLFFCL